MEKMIRFFCLVAVLGVVCMTVSEGGKPPKKPCHKLKLCKKDCAHGYVYDKDGCKTCTCKPPVCPPSECKIDCKYGKEVDKDKNGCKTCKCKPKPKCGPICKKFCPNGFVEDKYECPICVCKPPTGPICPKIKCGKGCWQEKDYKGCPVCKCKPKY